MGSNKANGSKAQLLRFWVSPSDLAVRVEVSIAEGIEQSVARLIEPCAYTDYHPSIAGDCPDNIAEELADLAWAAINGNCPDARYAGDDRSFDAAFDATIAHWDASNDLVEYPADYVSPQQQASIDQQLADCRAPGGSF